MSETQRESMEFDAVIVGAGPAGLAAAIRIKQRAQIAGREVNVCVLEKGGEPGAHVLSGAVIDPIALDELFPDWREMGAPLTQPVEKDAFVLLREKLALKLPTPPQMKNRGNYVASLGALTRWLGEQAEALGVEVFAGFAGAEVLYSDDGRVNGQGRVRGVATGDMGRGPDGQPGPNFEPGVELLAPYTLFAEGCRGSLSEQVIARFELRKTCDPQTYGLGVKEVWEVQPEKHKPGHVVHTVGWPLNASTYGGGFIYHLDDNDDNKVSIGFITGLDYANPYIDPFEEMQRFKTHPAIRPLLEGAKRIGYGARALNEGGFQSIPELTFPGGALIGAAAGFMNVGRIKGSHTAMKSAMVCADALVDAMVDALDDKTDLSAYPAALKQSWVYKELYEVRNLRPAFRAGLWLGLAYAAFDTYIMRGRAPWTFKHHHADFAHLDNATEPRRIAYPKPDGVVTFDRAASVYLANTAHDENQPCHLHLKDPAQAVSVNLLMFDGPEARFCPAGVYEFLDGPNGPDGRAELRINAANCIHCKTCDIKDPRQNITWTPPEGGSGPNYQNM